MTLIIYESRTGQVERFVERLKLLTDWHFVKLSPDCTPNEPYHLLTYTDGFGETPKMTADFLKSHGQKLLSVGSSGNKNWGEYQFAKAADNIAEHYHVPQSLKFELSGNKQYAQSFIQFVQNFQ